MFNKSFPPSIYKSVRLLTTSSKGSYVVRYEPARGIVSDLVMITAKHLHVTDIMVLLSPLPNKSVSFVYSSELFTPSPYSYIQPYIITVVCCGGTRLLQVTSHTVYSPNPLPPAVLLYKQLSQVVTIPGKFIYLRKFIYLV